MPLLSFPPDFLWGTSSASHQVEGQNFNNDWWKWEQTPGHIRNGDSSRISSDWWSGRYQEDFDRANSLGMNAHRMSVEWSRIEPREGEWDESAVSKYHLILEALIERGMKPFVTLSHFSLPLWVAEKGSWENPGIVQLFVRFVRRLVPELSDLCSHWVTLNEPNVLAYNGYVSGQFPPGVKSIGRALEVMRNEVRAHAGAYYAIKDLEPDAQIGMANHVRYFYPYNGNSPLDRLTAYLRNRLFNRLTFSPLIDGRFLFPLGFGQYLPELRGTCDFLGVNYYYTDRVKFDLAPSSELFGKTVLNPQEAELQKLFSSVGNIEPYGLASTLLEKARFGKPIYITENGIFDDGTDLQCRYLIGHLAAVHKAMSGGANVKGYFWWSLTDNFEWTEGYTSRFGLYHLDVPTQVRTKRPVADVFERIIRENGIPPDLDEAYGRSN